MKLETLFKYSKQTFFTVKARINMSMSMSMSKKYEKIKTVTNLPLDLTTAGSGDSTGIIFIISFSVNGDLNL